MSYFEKLKNGAYKNSDPYCMIELGLLYCGEDNNTFATQDPECAAVHQSDPAEGLRLIFKGVELGESRKPNSIMYTQYFRICGYYLSLENFLRKTGDFNNSNSEDLEMFIECLSGRVSFAKKALESATKNNGGMSPQELAIDPITPEKIRGLEKVVDEAVNDFAETKKWLGLRLRAVEEEWLGLRIMAAEEEKRRAEERRQREEAIFRELKNDYWQLFNGDTPIGGEGNFRNLAKKFNELYLCGYSQAKEWESSCTEWADSIVAKKEEIEHWKKSGLCGYCGGKFGIINKKCKCCGRLKNYWLV